MACPWYAVCPLRRFERQGRLTDCWSQQYCQTTNHWQHCRRYQMEEQGIPHPDHLLPDGTLDESLQ